MKVSRIGSLLAALLVLVLSAQASLAGASKEILTMNQTAAGALINAEGTVVRVMGDDSQSLEVFMEATDEKHRPLAGDGSTFEVFLTFEEKGVARRISAGQIAMRAAVAVLMLASDPAATGCTPLACGMLPAGFGAVETISRVEIIAVEVLDPETELQRPELAGALVLDSAGSAWMVK